MGTPPRAIGFEPVGRWPRAQASDTVTLDFDRRHRRRLRLATDSGTELLLDLPRAVALAEGDGLLTEAGAWIAVRAAEEPLLEATARDAHALARLAWHIGNRHVPAEIGPTAIRIRPDPVIAELIRGQGGAVREIVAPFQPEPGAYAGTGGGHAHTDGTHRHAG